MANKSNGVNKAGRVLLKDIYWLITSVSRQQDTEIDAEPQREQQENETGAKQQKTASHTDSVGWSIGVGRDRFKLQGSNVSELTGVQNQFSFIQFKAFIL